MNEAMQEIYKYIVKYKLNARAAKAPDGSFVLFISVGFAKQPMRYTLAPGAEPIIGVHLLNCHIEQKV